MLVFLLVRYPCEHFGAQSLGSSAAQPNWLQGLEQFLALDHFLSTINAKSFQKFSSPTSVCVEARSLKLHVLKTREDRAVLCLRTTTGSHLRTRLESNVFMTLLQGDELE